jgi:predicted KAP-like P-loop ATPase
MPEKEEIKKQDEKLLGEIKKGTNLHHVKDDEKHLADTPKDVGKVKK